jgi:polar amino acid transport system permease protein
MPATASKTTAHRGSRETLVRATTSAAVVGLLVLALLSVPGYDYDWDRIWGNERWVGLIVQGFLNTLWISALGILLGLVLGFLGGLARLSSGAIRSQLGATYVELVRGSPFLVQILVANYCIAPALASVGESLGFPEAVTGLAENAVVVGVIALGVFSGAYVTEIVRSAIQSIDRGQTEAALSQGMTPWQVLRHVLVPQALRRMVPPLTGELVSLVKESSLLMMISVYELTKSARQVETSTNKTFEVYLPLAILYLAITFPLSRLARRLELRLT